MDPALPPILLVDDNPDDAFLLRHLLAKARIENPITTVEDGLCAQRILADLMPCVVFTDLKMRVVNGVKLTGWIRQHEKLRELPVYMVSSSGEPKDRAAAKAAGIDEYLEKFPLPAKLGEIVRACCARAQANSSHDTPRSA
jgi:two-component system response regulator